MEMGFLFLLNFKINFSKLGPKLYKHYCELAQQQHFKKKIHILNKILHWCWLEDPGD